MYYIVEHPSRGLFVSKYRDGIHTKYHFAWHYKRTDDRAFKFRTLAEARLVSSAIPGSAILVVRKGKASHV